jgi:hypothetical protein
MHAAAVSMKAELHVGGLRRCKVTVVIEACTAIAHPRVTKAGPHTLKATSFPSRYTRNVSDDEAYPMMTQHIITTLVYHLFGVHVFELARRRRFELKASLPSRCKAQRNEMECMWPSDSLQMMRAMV